MVNISNLPPPQGPTFSSGSTPAPPATSNVFAGSIFTSSTGEVFVVSPELSIRTAFLSIEEALSLLKQTLHAVDYNDAGAADAYFTSCVTEAGILANGLANANKRFTIDSTLYPPTKSADDIQNGVIAAFTAQAALYNIAVSPLAASFSSYAAAAALLNNQINDGFKDDAARDAAIYFYNAAANDYKLNLNKYLTTAATTLTAQTSYNNGVGDYNSKAGLPSDSPSSSTTASLNAQINARNVDFSPVLPNLPQLTKNTDTIPTSFSLPTIFAPGAITSFTAVTFTPPPTPITDTGTKIVVPVQPNQANYIADALAQMALALQVFATGRNQADFHSNLVQSGILQSLLPSVDKPKAFIVKKPDTKASNSAGTSSQVSDSSEVFDLSSPQLQKTLGQILFQLVMQKTSQDVSQSSKGGLTANLSFISAMLAAKIARLALLLAADVIGQKTLTNVTPNQTAAQLASNVAFLNVLGSFSGTSDAISEFIDKAALDSNITLSADDKAQLTLALQLSIAGPALQGLGNSINDPNFSQTLVDAAQQVANSKNFTDLFNQQVNTNFNALATLGALGSTYNTAIANILIQQGVTVSNARQVAQSLTNTSFASKADLAAFLENKIGKAAADKALQGIQEQFGVAALNQTLSGGTLTGILLANGVSAADAQKLGNQQYQSIDDLRSSLTKVTSSAVADNIINNLGVSFMANIVSSQESIALNNALDGLANVPAGLKQTLKDEFTREIFGIVPGETPIPNSFFRKLVDLAVAQKDNQAKYGQVQTDLFKQTVLNTTDLNDFVTNYVMSPANFMSLWGNMYDGAKGSWNIQKTISIQV